LATEQQRRVREVFDAALDQPAELRQKFVAEACRGDAQLLANVNRLLAAKDRAAGMLDTPVWQRRESSASPAEPGSFIGPYKILRELGGGAGGMGIVYQAVRADEVFQRICAIKVIRAELAAEWLLDRFRQERQILAGLDHNNIARIVDGGSTPEGLPYFVMDYVDGPSINQFCADHGLGIRARMVLFQQVGRAVQYLHQNGVIHGDLKPPNILVGNDGTVKIVDFGIASAITSPAAADQSKTMLMTPGYASPEQMRCEPLGPSSDVYSLGVILYELLTGTRPFSAGSRSTSEILKEIASKDPIPPSMASPAGQGRQAITQDLDCVVLHAMHRDPKGRYPSAAAMNTDISNYLQDRPVEARHAGLLYKCEKLVLRNRPAALLGALALVLLALAGWQWEVQAKRKDYSGKIDQNCFLQQQDKDQRLEELKKEVLALQGADAATKDRIVKEIEEAELADVKNLVDSYRTSFPESIRVWPGMTKTRRRLLDDTDSYLREVTYVREVNFLVKKRPEELAEAWLCLANIQGNPHNPNLGDQEAAGRSIYQAQRLVENSTSPLKQQIEAAAQAIRTGK